MCSCDIDGRPDFHSATNRKARTPHQCYECGHRISTGERYWHHSGKWEGDIYTYSKCATCEAVSEALHKSQRAACGCSGWELGRMWEEIAEFCREHLYYDPETGEDLPRPLSRGPSRLLSEVWS